MDFNSNSGATGGNEGFDADDVTGVLQQLIESEKNLIALNRSKDSFLSIIGHDLKNPLHTILAYTEMLEEDPENITPEEIRELTGKIKRSVLRASNLLDDLMMWAKTQKNLLVIKKSKIDIPDLLDKTTSLFEHQLHNKELTVNKEFDHGWYFNTDADILETIVRNLLSNAIKFSNRGGNITLTAEDLPDSSVIKVTDEGGGMTPEETDKLFHIDRLFWKEGTEQEQGTGLGLIICKEMTESLDGTITVDSAKDTGTTITVCLPK